MINIGRVIFEKCRGYVDNRCYPLVAEQTTLKPFICYSRTSAKPQTTKDRMMYELESWVTLNIVTNKYDEGITLLQKITKEFDDFEGVVNDINVVDSQIESVSEYFMNDAYVQTVQLNIKTN